MPAYFLHRNAQSTPSVQARFELCSRERKAAEDMLEREFAGEESRTASVQAVDLLKSLFD